MRRSGRRKKKQKERPLFSKAPTPCFPRYCRARPRRFLSLDLDNSNTRPWLFVSGTIASRVHRSLHFHCTWRWRFAAIQGLLPASFAANYGRTSESPQHERWRCHRRRVQRRVQHAALAESHTRQLSQLVQVSMP